LTHPSHPARAAARAGAFDDLFAAALAAREQAYAPYSRFAVGAAVRAASGRIYAGCNMENAAYPVGICAEASALAAMIAQGEREMIEALVVADSPDPVTPCGACRQRLAEFGDAATPVHAAGPEGVRATYTLGELLPHGFGPKMLRR
jgi:cytidine deaminase